MQCVNCRFENMPGSGACARCGTSMTLSTATINVHPPRAPRWFKPARRFARGGNLTTRVRESMRKFKATSIAESKIAPSFTPDVALRLIVPGWAQFYLRRRGRGYVFMIGAAIALLVAIVFVGTGWGNLALGALFSLHSASISDAVMAPGGSVRASMASGLLVYVALGATIYLPMIYLVTRVTIPYRLQNDVAPFLQDDVLLVRRFGKLHPGNVIVYNREERRIEGELMGQEHTYLYINGLGIDRILAGPGDHVLVNKGVLLVNGSPVKFRPLNGVDLPSLDTYVPADNYFVWPSSATRLSPIRIPIDAALVPATEISGVVYFRSSPWSRAGVVR